VDGHSAYVAHLFLAQITHDYKVKFRDIFGTLLRCCVTWLRCSIVWISDTGCATSRLLKPYFSRGYCIKLPVILFITMFAPV